MKLSTFFILVYFISIVTMISSHEEVHKVIYGSYGIESEINIFSFPSHTLAEKPCPKDSNCELAHNINEAIGYQLFPILLLTGFGFWIMILILEAMYELQLEKSKHP